MIPLARGFRTPTDRLLNAIAFGMADRVDRARVDWARFEHEAALHGLSGLVFLRLKRDVREADVPPATLDALRRAYLGILSGNLRARGALAQVARAATRFDGPVVVLRGIGLLESVYDDPGARPVTDIDLLVAPGRVPHLAAVLAGGGLVPADERHLFCDGVVVDLHDDPADAYRVPARSRMAGRAFSALDTVPLPGYGPLRAPGPADQASLAALHALKHGFGRKIWLVDLWRLARSARKEGTWSADLARMRARGLGPVLQAIDHAFRARVGCPFSDGAAGVRGSLRFLIGRPGAESLIEPMCLLLAARGPAGRGRCILQLLFPRDPQLPPATGSAGAVARRLCGLVRQAVASRRRPLASSRPDVRSAA